MSRPRVLYVSSSIGLGHVSRDLAIARELRRLQPDIEVLWVAASPASDVLREAGESVEDRALADVWRAGDRYRDGGSARMPGPGPCWCAML